MSEILKSLKSSNGRLARRLVTHVILASTFIALFSTTIELYSEFKRDVRSVHAELTQIERTHLDNIASRVWVLDKKELQTTLNNLLNLPSIQYVAAYENDELLMTAGTLNVNNVVVQNYPLTYIHNNKKIPIGKLVVKASLDNAYQRAIDHAIVVLISNTVKTFIVAAFILLIFYKLVAQHLEKITSFAAQLNINNLDTRFEYNRKQNRADKQDELDLLKLALHKMQNRLLSAIEDRHDSQAQVKLILDSTAEAIYGINTAGECTFINPACLEMLRYDDATELLGRNMHEAIHHSQSDGTPCLAEQSPIINTYRQGTPAHTDTEVLWRKDGSSFPAEYWSHPIVRDEECVGAVVTFVDITTRLESVTALRQREKNLSITLNSMLDAVITTDDSGIILTFNRAAETLFGYDSVEIIGQNVKHLVPEPHSTKYDNCLLHYIDPDNSQNAGEGREVRGQRKNKEIFPMRLMVAELAEGIYAKRRFITSCLDLSQLRLQELQLRRSQKMDAMGKLTGGISHDYNNMLGVIIGYAELLEQGITDNPQLKHYAHQIQHAGKRGAKLTKKLSSFSRQQPSDQKNYNINDLLKDEKHLLEKSLTSRISLIFKLADSLWTVKLDSDNLADAILNICINAMHAMNSVGKLTIETRNKTITKTNARLLNVTSGDFVQITISDTGCGMTDTLKEKIFDPFFTTKGEMGSGLGLSQVYGFVNRSGGTIKVNSVPDQGTQIILYFPRHLDSDDGKPIKFKPKISDLTGTETILIVDDEPALLKLTFAILNRQGYQILCANHGNKALQMLQDNNVDLLLSDVIMPEMDGYQLAAIAQKKYPTLKIQLASGYSDQRQSIMNDSTLHNNLLQKPYDSHLLLEKIRELLDF